MIDTVRYYQTHQLRTNWQNQQRGIFTLDPDSAFRAFCDGRGNLTWFEVSLPRLLFGTNRRLITSQRQIEAAFLKADKVIQRIVVPSQQAQSQRNFTRVDLVWQFRAYTQPFFLAHQHVDHPEIHKRVSIHRNKHRCTGITWSGERMTINMYDKTRKGISGFPIPIVRVEVQLHGEKLRDKFKQNPISSLSLPKCYEIYRSIVVKFQPVRVPELSSKDEILGYAQRKGIPVMQHLVRTMSPRAVRSFRRNLSAYLFQSKKINWQRLLPPKLLPPVA